jgi:hypothetical protein
MTPTSGPHRVRARLAAVNEQAGDGVQGGALTVRSGG